MDIIPVILAGGAGTRLWPASRKGFPKPFMAMPDGETLLGKTLLRAQALAGSGPILTVTNNHYAQLASSEYQRVGSHVHTHHFLIEPEARNTAPAIAMAAAWAGREYGQDTCLMVLPSDHLIEDLEAFLDAAGKAAALARLGRLVTFGIRPGHPETGYGYIKSGGVVGDGFEVDRFVEKPDLETARQYLASGDYLWNSGMFCFTPKGFLTAAREVAPELSAATGHCLNATPGGTTLIPFDAAAFGRMPSISVDYAVFERAPDVAVVDGSFDWNDVGSWQSIAELDHSNDNRATGEAVFVDSRNVYVNNPQRLVATIGVDNLLIVDTPDALLICEREKSQDVKHVVEELKQRNSPLVDQHLTQHHTWGIRQPLDDDLRCSLLKIDPRASCPFDAQNDGLNGGPKGGLVVTVISGEATFQPDPSSNPTSDEPQTLRPGDSLTLAPGQGGKLKNIGDNTLAVTEIGLPA